MQKSSQVISQQLQYLKKSLKNKRNSQKWEHCIQFYRNNQSSLSNYHILQLIKLAFKPLKSTMNRSCRYISKLSSMLSKHSDDKKIADQITQQKKILQSKLLVLSTLLDSYTLTLQSVLSCSDQQYFNMIYREDYQRHHQSKQLIFEPISNFNEKQQTSSVLEYQMLRYFSFVAEASLIYCTTIFCLGVPNVGVLLKGVDNMLGSVFQSSHKLATRQLQFEILKLNIIQKSDQTPLRIYYKIPIQCLHNISKNSHKWSPPHKKSLFLLLLRYLFLTIHNINNPSLHFPLQNQQKNRQLNIENQIYAYMKEILLLYQEIFQGKDEIGYVNFGYLEFLNSAVQAYECKIYQMKFWKELIRKFFQIQKIQAMRSDQGINVEISAGLKNIGIFLLNRRQDANLKQCQFIFQSKKLNQTHENQTKSQKKQLKLNRQLQRLISNMGSIFNFIEQSDSDEDGNMGHLFEKQRRDQIIFAEKQRYEKKFRRYYEKYVWDSKGNQEKNGKVKPEKGEEEDGGQDLTELGCRAQSKKTRALSLEDFNKGRFCEYGEVTSRLIKLENKIVSLKKQAKKSIVLLKNQRESKRQTQYLHRAQQSSHIEPLPNLPSQKISHNKDKKSKILSLALPRVNSSNKSLNLFAPSQKIPLTCSNFIPLTFPQIPESKQGSHISTPKQQCMSTPRPVKYSQQGQQTQQPVRHIQTICLSDRYDQMSRNLLLNNTQNGPNMGMMNVNTHAKTQKRNRLIDRFKTDNIEEDSEEESLGLS